jgi:hypothetical protein
MMPTEPKVQYQKNLISKFPKAKSSRDRSVGKTPKNTDMQAHADHKSKYRISENRRSLGAAIAAHRT